MSEVMSRPLVRLRDLNVTFRTRDRTVHAVNGVDMDVGQGEVLCILGESGSGKSVTLRALMYWKKKKKTMMLLTMSAVMMTLRRCGKS